MKNKEEEEREHSSENLSNRDTPWKLQWTCHDLRQESLLLILGRFFLPWAQFQHQGQHLINRFTMISQTLDCTLRFTKYCVRFIAFPLCVFFLIRSMFSLSI